MSEWISIKDRLPPKELEEVLVYLSEGQARIGYLHQEKMKVSCDYCGEDNYVTHWMELPKPPEVVDE